MKSPAHLCRGTGADTTGTTTPTLHSLAGSIKRDSLTGLRIQHYPFAQQATVCALLKPTNASGSQP